MKFMIIEGNVVGGHFLKDLGLHIAYKERVSIPEERARWSTNLSYALRNKQVLKIGVKDTNTVPSLPPTARIKPSAPPVKKKKRPVPSPPPKRDEAEELRRMNKALMKKIDTLTESQSELLQALQSALEKGSLQTTKVERVVVTPQGSPVTSEDDLVEEEEIFFIPSKIRSEKTKVQDIEVHGETKEAGEKMDASMEALKVLKKKRKKKSDS